MASILLAFYNLCIFICSFRFLIPLTGCLLWMEYLRVLPVPPAHSSVFHPKCRKVYRCNCQNQKIRKFQKIRKNFLHLHLHHRSNHNKTNDLHRIPLLAQFPVKNILRQKDSRNVPADPVSVHTHFFSTELGIVKFFVFKILMYPTP